MKQFLLDKIVDPTDGNPLELRSGNLVGSVSKKSYQVLGEIPVLLLEKPEALKPKTEAKSLSDKVFDYTEHYQRDAEMFDYSATVEDGATLHENRRLHQTILRQLEGERKLVLDVGCGNGWVSKSLCPKNIHVISMDISTTNPIKALQAVPSEYHAGLVADVFNLPLEKDAIDCIIASEIMEHVPDPKLFIEKLVAALSPGGMLLITTPYDEKIRYHLCVHCNCATPENAHLHSFNENNIAQYLPKDGIEVSLYKFSNKLLNRLKTHFIIQYMPFGVWQLVDRLANKLFKKETRLMIKIQKIKAV